MILVRTSLSTDAAMMLSRLLSSSPSRLSSVWTMDCEHSSKMLRPAMVTANDMGLRRAPPQAVQ